MELPPKPHQWALVPEQTASPNLWRGAIASIPLWFMRQVDANQLTYDQASRSFRTLLYSSNRFAPVLTPQGRAVLGDGANNIDAIIRFPHTLLSGRSEFTILSVQRPLVVTTDRTIIGCWSTGNTMIIYHYDNNSQIRVIIATSAGTIDANTSSGYAAGRLDRTALIMRTNGEVACFINGRKNVIQAPGTARTVSAPAGGTDIGWLGEPTSDASTDIFNGPAHFLHVMSRGITDGEAYAWSNDPWALLRPKSPSPQLLAFLDAGGTPPEPMTVVRTWLID